MWSACQSAAPFAVQVPVGCATVGDTVRTAMRHGNGIFVDSRPRQAEEEIWKSLCDVIVEQLGVPPERVTPHASFVDDLFVS
jgi:hypothetical protein